jgi:Flp pilus assembly pilin Flp
MFSAFLRDELGATAIEYGLIAALVAVAALFGGVKDKVNAKMPQ